MSFFVHAQGIKTVHARGGGGKKWQNSGQVVVECPLTLSFLWKIKIMNLIKYIPMYSLVT